MLGFRALAVGPLTEIRGAQAAQTSIITVRFASRTFVTRSTDTPADAAIIGRIAAGLRVERRLASTEGGQFGSLLETSFGEIELKNGDGALDSLSTRYAADGRQIRLKIGATEFDTFGRERVQPFAFFATVYIASGGPWTFEHDVLRLRIEDLTNRLHGRIQLETYTGAGGSGGMAEIAGRTKPLMFGRVSNATVQLVDPGLLIYQLHSGNIELISAVYDAGVAVPFDGDYPTYDDLVDSVVVAGSYASCLATGHIKLAIVPVGAITVDARGHKDNVSGNYIETTSDVIRTILRDFGAIPTSEVDTAAFIAATALQPGDIGFFLPAGDQSTVLDVIQRLAFAAGFFVGDRAGRVTIQRLDPPSPTIVHWSFTDRDIINIERLSLPYSVPWKAWGVGYDVNWTVQSESELASGVPQTRRAYLKAERRYVYAQDADIALFHASSAGAPLRESFFVGADVAEAEAARLIGLYSYGRALYDVVVKNALFSVHVGQTVRITYHRWDLDGGKDFVVVGAADDADRVESTLRLFG